MKTTITFLMVLLFSITITTAQDKIYVHTATVENTTNDITYINHPDLNGNPNAGIVYSHVWNPNGGPSVFNDNFTTLFYSTVENKWSIATEDFSDIVMGSHYNIYIATNESSVITHIASPANIGQYGDYTTVIDDPLLNGVNPGPYAVISNYYNPNSVANIARYAFYYDGIDNKRAAFNTHNVGNPVPDGAAFKILIQGEGTTKFGHFTNVDNVTSNFTMLDNASINDNPNATFVFSNYWNLNGSATIIEPGMLGSWYNSNTGRWGIYYENTSTVMAEGLSFDIIVADQEILGINDNEVEVSIKMYPNPAIEATTITSTQEITNITVFNILGQEVASFKGEGINTQIDISNLTTGNYLVKVTAENGNSETLKLIKQ